MSDLGNKAVFSKNLRNIMEERHVTRNQMCADLGFVYSTFSDWYNGKKYPRIDKIEMMANYFQIIEESNALLLCLLNKQRIQSSQYFPIYAFSSICPEIDRIEELKQQQQAKIESLIASPPSACHGNHLSPQAVIDDPQIPQTYKTLEMICSIMSGQMNLGQVEDYLRNFMNKRSTDYRKLLCAYDLKNNM